MFNRKPVGWGAVVVAGVIGALKVVAYHHVEQSSGASASLRPMSISTPTTQAALALKTRTPDQLFAEASPAVALITVMDRSLAPIAQGSGFFISGDGLLVTNYHVIRGVASAAVRGGDGRAYVVSGAVAVAPDVDLALLQVSPARSDVPHLSLSPADSPSIGSRVFAIGNPLGLTNTLSDGLVSGMRTLPEFKGTLIQTSAPISPGSSGGPLMTADGAVVGVTSAGMLDGQNLNFAVPAEHVRKLIASRGTIRNLSEVSPAREASPQLADGRPATRQPSNAAPGRAPELPKAPLDAADVLVRRKQYPAAMGKLREVSDADQNGSRYWYLLGRVQEEGFGNFDVAEDAYRHAIKVTSTDKPSYERLGMLLTRRARFTQAIDVYRALAKIDPKDPSGYIGAGVAAIGNGNGEQALSFFEWALKLRPQDPTIHELRGRALYSLKRDDEAMTEFKAVLRIDPKSVDSMIGVAEVHFRAGRFAEARAGFIDVLRLYPSSPRAHLQLGRLAQRDGDLATAQAEWAKAALIAPGTADGREALARLEQTSRGANRVR